MDIRKEDIGVRIRTIREKLGMTQAQFASVTGFGSKSISGYELGNSDTSPIFLAKVAELGNTTIDWIVTGQLVEQGNSTTTVAEKTEHYSPEALTVADMFEVKVGGKTPQERLDFIREIMDTIRRKG